MFIYSIFFWANKFVKGNVIKNINIYKFELFMFFIFIVFLLSLLPLQIFAAGNRSLVLLPLVVLIVGATTKQAKINIKRIMIFIIVFIVCTAQLYQSLAWVYIKIAKSPQGTASEWIKKNIKNGQVIGLENIPIYQYIPEIIQKEFYYKQYGVKQKADYAYQLISSKSKKLPDIIIISNAEIETKLFQLSSKKLLVQRLQKEKYKKVFIVNPNYSYFKFFGNENDYYLSGLLVASPNTIAIYKK